MCLSREGCSWPWTGAEKTEGTRRRTLLGEAQVMGSRTGGEGSQRGLGARERWRARNGLEQGGRDRVSAGWYKHCSSVPEMGWRGGHILTVGGRRLGDVGCGRGTGWAAEGV